MTYFNQIFASANLQIKLILIQDKSDKNSENNQSLWSI